MKARAYPYFMPRSFKSGCWNFGVLELEEVGSLEEAKVFCLPQEGANNAYGIIELVRKLENLIRKI